MRAAVKTRISYLLLQTYSSYHLQIFNPAMMRVKTMFNSMVNEDQDDISADETQSFTGVRVIEEGEW